MTHSKPATRDDVARLAGVSSAVVSYVLNDGPRPVAEATRQRVLDAVAKLGYRPNAAARAFRLQRSDTFGLTVPDISNPFFAELAKAIQDRAGDRGYAVVVADTDHDPAREASQIRFLVDRQVDGAMIIGHTPGADFSPLLDARIPLVTFHRFEGDEAIPTVSIDDYAAARAGLDHLLAHGHRRIAFIGSASDLPDIAGRRRAWIEALDLPEADIEALAVESDVTRAGGYAAARELMSRDTGATAVFVTTGSQSIGALRAFTEAGVRVPDDLAMLSYDGTQESEFTSPPLSSIRPPLELVASLAIGLLVDDETEDIHPVVPHQFIVRDSCGAHPIRG